jgi:hypothetical protein
MTTFCEVVPPLPVHANVNVVPVVNGPTFALPESAFVPAQAPIPLLPAQLVALVALQVNVVLAPLATVVAAALNATVGADEAGEPATVIVACDWPLTPAVVVQVSTYVVVAVNGPTL